jgi:nucleotide-binding universal stress UspA family protein
VKVAKPIKKILCPTDCSEGSRAALDYAIQLAESFDAELLVLRAFHVTYHVRPDLSVWTEAHGHRSIIDVVKADAEVDMREFLASVDDATKKRITVEVEHGEEVPTILAAAERDGVDLIVMGTHGRTGLAHVALGSVTERVVRHAACPVLTVRRPS